MRAARGRRAPAARAVLAGRRLHASPPVSATRAIAPPALLATLALLATAALEASAASAQEPPAASPETPDPIAEPPMAEAPRAFRLAGGVGFLRWPDEAATAELDGGATVGLEVESRVLAWLGFRLGLSYGRASAVPPNAGLQPDAATEVAQFVVDLASALRLPPSALGWPAVPFVGLGVASVVHDPDFEGLPTRSQGAHTIGAGLEWAPPGRFGARAEWRRYSVGSQDLFDPVERTSTRRSAHLFGVSAFWEL